MQSQLETLLSRAVAGLGFELVKAENNGRNVRVFIDQPKGVSVDDCARVSDHLSRLLEVEQIEFARLEVSSPGLDRELTKRADFVRFAGRKARMTLKNAIDGRKNFSGTLREVKDDTLMLKVEGADVAIALANVAKARLVPQATEALRRKK